MDLLREGNSEFTLQCCTERITEITPQCSIEELPGLHCSATVGRTEGILSLNSTATLGQMLGCHREKCAVLEVLGLERAVKFQTLVVLMKHQRLCISFVDDGGSSLSGTADM